MLSSNNPKGNQTIIATTKITNTGKYSGEEVVQLYISDPVASIARAVKDLKGFKKIMLQPGESNASIISYYNRRLEIL